jgi:cell division protein ZapA
MPQVMVTIAGKTYRMACAEGEESHLEGLAAFYDGKIQEMRSSFGEIGDMRLHVMAAITLADEMHEMKRRMAGLEAELAEMRRFASKGDERTQAIEARLADSVQKAAERIEQLARSLNAPGQG